MTTADSARLQKDADAMEQRLAKLRVQMERERAERDARLASIPTGGTQWGSSAARRPRLRHDIKGRGNACLEMRSKPSALLVPPPAKAALRAAAAPSVEPCALAPGALLRGAYSEEDSRAAFLGALREWRTGQPEPVSPLVSHAIQTAASESLDDSVVSLFERMRASRHAAAAGLWAAGRTCCANAEAAGAQETEPEQEAGCRSESEEQSEAATPHAPARGTDYDPFQEVDHTEDERDLFSSPQREVELGGTYDADDYVTILEVATPGPLEALTNASRLPDAVIFPSV